MLSAKKLSPALYAVIGADKADTGMRIMKGDKPGFAEPQMWHLLEDTGSDRPLITAAGKGAVLARLQTIAEKLGVFL